MPIWEIIGIGLLAGIVIGAAVYVLWPRRFF